MKTGNTHSSEDIPRVQRHASMEPGHEDREYPAPLRVELSRIGKPQWSPVMKTGNTYTPREKKHSKRSLNGARS